MSTATPRNDTAEAGRRAMRSRRCRRREDSTASTSPAASAVAATSTWLIVGSRTMPPFCPSWRAMSGKRDAWVELGVGDFDEQVDEAAKHRYQHGNAHDRLVIEVLKGVRRIEAESRAP